jgi:hypothetical protein
VSNSENFIDEVTEEVRRDRLFYYMRRYGWIAILLIVALVGAAAWVEFRRGAAQETAQDFGDALTMALESPDAAGRSAALQDMRTREAGLRAALVDLLAAGEAVASDDRTAALARLTGIAGDAGLPSTWRDLARLRLVTLAGPDMPAAERRSTLDALAIPGAPYRPLALEQLALLSVEAGDTPAALTQLRALLQEPDLTPGLRQRATQLIVALGGQPDAS